MSIPEQSIQIMYMTPIQAQEYLHLAKPDSRLNLGITQFNRQTGEGTIIINSLLSPFIRQAIEVQERVQYEMMLGYITLYPDRPVEGIMPHAHYAGLDAGVARAKQLGILEDFLKIRGLGETEESIRTALRP